MTCFAPLSFKNIFCITMEPEISLDNYVRIPNNVESIEWYDVKCLTWKGEKKIINYRYLVNIWWFLSLWNKYDLIALMTLSLTRNERIFQFWNKPTVTLQFCEKMRCSMNWISRAIFHFDKKIIFAHQTQHKTKKSLKYCLLDIEIFEKKTTYWKAQNWTMAEQKGWINTYSEFS